MFLERLCVRSFHKEQKHTSEKKGLILVSLNKTWDKYSCVILINWGNKVEITE